MFLKELSGTVDISLVAQKRDSSTARPDPEIEKTISGKE
jgi:hypothetical protein